MLKGATLEIKNCCTQKLKVEIHDYYESKALIKSELIIIVKLELKS